MTLPSRLLILLPLPHLAWVGGKYPSFSVVLQRFLGVVVLVAKISLLSACSMPSYSTDLVEGENIKKIEMQEIKPYSLPTFSGAAPTLHTKIDPYVESEYIDADAIFKRVMRCYPHKSKWAIDVELRGAVSSDAITNSSGSSIGRNYVQIVASMPLYSAKEMDRAVKNEHDLRQETAKTVSSFIQAIADRNHALRMVSLYSSLEKRASVRVQSGVVSSTEQVGYLEKVAKAHKAKNKAEADIMTARIALSSMCTSSTHDAVNDFLVAVGKAP